MSIIKIFNMKNDILLKFGQKVRYERVKQKMSQEELAALAGLNFRSISYIECGKHDIKLTTIEKIANALKLEVAYILNFRL